MTEKEYAEMEAAANYAEDEFFRPRPLFDGFRERQMFNAGFKRAWEVKGNDADKRIKELEESIEATKMPFCNLLDVHFNDDHFKHDSKVFIELQRKLYSVKGGA